MSVLVALVGALAVNRQRVAATTFATKEAEVLSREAVASSSQKLAFSYDSLLFVLNGSRKTKNAQIAFI